MFDSSLTPGKQFGRTKRRRVGTHALRLEALETRDLLAHVTGHPVESVDTSNSGLPEDDENGWTPKLSIAVDDFQARVLAEGGTFSASDWHGRTAPVGDTPESAADSVNADSLKGKAESKTNVEIRSNSNEVSQVDVGVDPRTDVSSAKSGLTVKSANAQIVDRVITVELPTEALALDASLNIAPAEEPTEFAAIDVDGLPQQRIVELAELSGLQRFDSDGGAVQYALDQSFIDSAQAQQLINNLADAIAGRNIDALRSLSVNNVQQAVRLLSLEHVRETLLDRVYQRTGQTKPQPPLSGGGGAGNEIATPPSGPVLRPPSSGGQSLTQSSAFRLFQRFGDAIATKNMNAIRSIGVSQMQHAVRQFSIDEVRGILLDRLRSVND